MKLNGNVWLFGDNIDTDLIFPGHYLSVTELQELGRLCMSGIDIDFYNKISQQDIIVAGKNFGCGSSREHAPLSIKYCGISCIIALSFSRIFYRNAINIGLPIFLCEKVSSITQGDNITVDIKIGRIKNNTSGQEYDTVTFPPFIQELIKEGGLIEYVNKHINNEE